MSSLETVLPPPRRATRAALDPPAAWMSFLRAHAALTRQMDADLLSAHGLTLNDYEVLLRLFHADERRMRRVDLARSVLLTQSGMTRLLEGLQAEGLVESLACRNDRRVVWARLTEAGAMKLRAAAKTHMASIRSRFSAHFTEAELATLAELLGRLPGAPMPSCSP